MPPARPSRRPPDHPPERNERRRPEPPREPPPQRRDAGRKDDWRRRESPERWDGSNQSKRRRQDINPDSRGWDDHGATGRAWDDLQDAAANVYGDESFREGEVDRSKRRKRTRPGARGTRNAVASSDRRPNDDCVAKLVGVPSEYEHDTLIELHATLGLDPASLISSEFNGNPGSSPTCTVLVTYDSPASAEQAVRTLDGEQVTGASEEIRVLKASIGAATASQKNFFYPSVFMSSIPADFTEANVKELHSQAGIEDHVIMDIDFQRCREKEEFRSATIYYMEDADAMNAIASLSNHPVVSGFGKERSLRCRASKEWRDRDSEAANKADEAANSLFAAERDQVFEQAEIVPSLFIHDVPIHFSEQDMHDFHAACGLDLDSIVEILFRQPKADAQEFRSCILKYADEESAMSAISSLSMHPLILENGEEKQLFPRPAREWLESGSPIALKANGDREWKKAPHGKGREKGKDKTARHYHVDIPAGEFILCTIKTWLEDKAFGFAELDLGGPEVFVHVKLLSGMDPGDLRVGTRLKVCLHWDADKSRWSTIKACGPDGPSPAELAEITKINAKLMPSEPSSKSAPRPKPRESKSKPPPQASPELQEFCDRLDLPVVARTWMRVHLKPKVQAMVIETFVPDDSIGVEYFKQIERFAYKLEASMHDVQTGVPLPGKAKAWKEDRGFGFVSLTDGPDVFVHQAYLTDGSFLTPGSPVEVVVKWDPKFEQWVAEKCTGASGFKLTAESNLHVVGLPLDCSEESVTAFFTQYGPVARVKILDPGQLRGGEAMVHMGTEADALKVMENLNCTFPEWSSAIPLVVETAAQFMARRLGQNDSLSADIEVTTDPAPKTVEFIERTQIPDQLQLWLGKFPAAAQALLYERYDMAYAEASSDHSGNDGLSQANKVILSLAKEVMAELNGQKSQPPTKLQSFRSKWSLDTETMNWMISLPSVVQDMLIERFGSRKIKASSSSELQIEGDKGELGDPLPADIDETRLYVSGVPARVTKDQLYSAFNDYGFVTYCRLLPPINWGTRTAIIRVEDAQQADLCIRGLNGNSDVFPGMKAPLEVLQATPLREIEGANDWLFIQNLPDTATETDLKQILSEHGRVKRVELKGFGAWTGVAAKACMMTVEEAAMCVECLHLDTPPALSQQMFVGFDYWMSNSTIVSPQARMHGQAVRDLGKALLKESGFQGVTRYKKKAVAPKKVPAPTGTPQSSVVLKIQGDKPKPKVAGIVPKSSSPFAKG